jgi:hypothetical protein
MQLIWNSSEKFKQSTKILRNNLGAKWAQRKQWNEVRFFLRMWNKGIEVVK